MIPEFQVEPLVRSEVGSLEDSEIEVDDTVLPKGSVRTRLIAKGIGRWVNEARGVKPVSRFLNARSFHR